MSGIACGIVGALIVSVVWMFGLALLCDRHAAERREWQRGARWREVGR
jgi:hypothetical protein